MTLVMVYGTLRQGQPNHPLLEGAELLGEATTRPEFRMLSNGWFPYVQRAEQGYPIHGEVYAVDATTLACLDRLEGVPHHYQREKIEVTLSCRKIGDNNGCGNEHHTECFCNEDCGAGYTFADEWGECDYCEGKFEEGTLTCYSESNELKECIEGQSRAVEIYLYSGDITRLEEIESGNWKDRQR